MNRGEIKTTVRSYSHRDNLDTLLDGWVDKVNAELGRVLRDSSNYVRTDFTPTGRYSDLPADFGSMAKLTDNADGGGEYKVQSGNDGSLIMSSESGEPYYYQIAGTQIAIVPTTGRTLNMAYYATPTPMASDTDTNAVATKWPFLYVYGCLMELAAVEQDADLYNGYAAAYARELNMANGSYKNQPETMSLQVA